MRRLLAGALVAGSIASLGAGSAVLVQHGAPAAEVLCVGNRTADGKCDLVWLNYSVESRRTAGTDDGKRVNCPKATVQPAQPECYQGYEDTRSTSPGWGSAASTPIVGKTSAGPVELGGVYYGSGAADARAWVGVRVLGVGSGSVAAGAGRNTAGDGYACLTMYGNDETPGHTISSTLADIGLSDDRTDYDTDVQFCGEFLRGIL